MYVTYDQEQALKAILEGLTVNKKPRMHLAELVEDHNLLDALKLDPYTESIKEDILNVAEIDGLELTDEQIDELTSSIKKYDYSDYNEFISNQISEMVNKENVSCPIPLSLPLHSY